MIELEHKLYEVPGTSCKLFKIIKMLILLTDPNEIRVIVRKELTI